MVGLLDDDESVTVVCMVRPLQSLVELNYLHSQVLVVMMVLCVNV